MLAQKSVTIFSGGQADVINWWETLPVSAECCPLKAFAVIIHLIIPHAADIEHYFLGLGGVQSMKHCNLSVQTFKSLSKHQVSYAIFLHKVDHKASRPACRKYAHMHTWPEHGLNTALADELQRSFAWVPPLAGASRNSDNKFLAGPESIADEELLEEFYRFENEMLELQGLQEGTGKVPDIFKGDIIGWNELEKVDKGITPTGFVEEIDVVAHGSQGMEPGWNINALLMSESEGVVQ
ncbi:hypothetical protein BD769DRAFT_1357775 [Suillus cothurnatus]|nr:hypothetical protein BD769DRAFT_1357775 [Suillus cothurnatus]